MITVEVSYRDATTGEPVADDEVSRIFVAVETPQAVVLSIETTTKYPTPQAYSCAGFDFVTAKGNVASVRVSNIPFDNVVVIAQAGRYSIYLAFFTDVSQDARQVYPPAQ